MPSTAGQGYGLPQILASKQSKDDTAGQVVFVYAHILCCVLVGLGCLLTGMPSDRRVDASFREGFLVDTCRACGGLFMLRSAGGRVQSISGSPGDVLQ